MRSVLHICLLCYIGCASCAQADAVAARIAWANQHSSLEAAEQEARVTADIAVRALEAARESAVVLRDGQLEERAQAERTALELASAAADDLKKAHDAADCADAERQSLRCRLEWRETAYEAKCKELENAVQTAEEAEDAAKDARMHAELEYKYAVQEARAESAAARDNQAAVRAAANAVVEALQALMQGLKDEHGAQAAALRVALEAAMREVSTAAAAGLQATGADAQCNLGS